MTAAMGLLSVVSSVGGVAMRAAWSASNFVAGATGGVGLNKYLLKQLMRWVRVDPGVSVATCRVTP